MDVRILSKLTGGESVDERVPPPRRRWLIRVFLPALILLLTGGLLAYAARDALWPLKPVRVVRVVAKEGGRQAHLIAETATVSVQAPGWIEPDPYPVYITALTNGVIEKVLVLEGESVEAEQVVAEMIDDDARLAVAGAEADLARRMAALRAAQTHWENPVALERAFAVNRAWLTEAKAERSRLDAAIDQEMAKLSELKVAHDRLRKLLPNAAAELEVEQAQYRLEAQRALVVATQKQRPVIDAKVTRYAAEVQAAEADLRLRVSLRRAIDEAQGAVSKAHASLAEARLRQARMKIVSPVDGIVMERLVVPGSKVMLDMDRTHSAHVLHVYDPNQLQVRVDVPLADVAKVAVSQRAIVVVDVLPDEQFAGEVTRLGHQADISKNTVEVKVRIEHPSRLLKPDMLARVKFLGSHPSEQASPGELSSMVVYAPKRAVQGEGREPYVWLVMSGESRLRRQSVRLGPERSDGWVQISDGLQPGDVLVVEPTGDLQEGERVSVVDEDV